MTKGEFIDKVADKADLSKKDAGAAVDAFLDSVEDALKERRSVAFTGFGKFTTQQRAARVGVNPRNPSEKVQIPAATVPKFSAGSALKAAVTGSTPPPSTLRARAAMRPSRRSGRPDRTSVRLCWGRMLTSLAAADALVRAVTTGGPLSPEAAARQLLALASGPPSLARAILDQVVDGDARLVRRAGDARAGTGAMGGRATRRGALLGDRHRDDRALA